jgi:hypothetical protein
MNNAHSYERAQARLDRGLHRRLNAEVEEIWAMVADGTEIDIRP